jgi:hypothetical protein
MSDKEEADKARFMKYVSKDENGCWRWTGGRAITGYCSFFYNGSCVLAHRAAMLVFKKLDAFTPGMQVAHSCNNRDCVNPDHLSEKTREENNGADKRAHGTAQTGEKCHFSKLTWDIVKDIRASTERPKWLAARYDVSPATILSILHNKTWKQE